MPQGIVLAALAIGCYLLGCLVGAYYLVRWRTGRDLRSFGSGNAGARNAGRVLGHAAFAFSLVVDAGKGALATWLGLQIDPQPLATVIAMTAVIVGHIWPAQLRFRGGKGAATALGIMLVFDPIAAVMLLAGGTVVLVITRRFTLSGLAAIVATPIVAAWRGHALIAVASLGVMALLIVYAHRSNLREVWSSLGRASSTGRQEVVQ